MIEENSKNKKTKNNHSYKNDDYESQITNLLEQINNYVSKGEYDKAEKLKKQIEILKKKSLTKNKKLIKSRQSKENENLENLYKTEIEKINDEWNEKFKDLDKRSKEAVKKLIKKHQNEMEDLYKNIEKNFPVKLRPSSEFLRLEKEEQQLVKFQRFNEANVIKKKKEKQKKIDIEKANKEKQIKIKNEAIKKNKRHELEKNMLNKKF